MSCLRGSGFETEIPETKAKVYHQGWTHTRDYVDIQNAKPRQTDTQMTLSEGGGPFSGGSSMPTFVYSMTLFVLQGVFSLALIYSVKFLSFFFPQFTK
jgi:hypothetical protein